jgi:hypothetical protein
MAWVIRGERHRRRSERFLCGVSGIGRERATDPGKKLWL